MNWNGFCFLSWSVAELKACIWNLSDRRGLTQSPERKRWKEDWKLSWLLKINTFFNLNKRQNKTPLAKFIFSFSAPSSLSFLPTYFPITSLGFPQDPFPAASGPLSSSSSFCSCSSTSTSASPLSVLSTESSPRILHSSLRRSCISGMPASWDSRRCFSSVSERRVAVSSCSKRQLPSPSNCSRCVWYFLAGITKKFYLFFFTCQYFANHHLHCTAAVLLWPLTTGRVCAWLTAGRCQHPLQPGKSSPPHQCSRRWCTHPRGRTSACSVHICISGEVADTDLCNCICMFCSYWGVVFNNFCSFTKIREINWQMRSEPLKLYHKSTTHRVWKTFASLLQDNIKRCESMFQPLG